MNNSTGKLPAVIQVKLANMNSQSLVQALEQLRDLTDNTVYVRTEEVAQSSLGTHPDASLDVPSDWTRARTIPTLNERICNCMNCGLGSTRTRFVFGSGNENADVMVIGEAPGAEEDASGEPFVGRAGQLLNKILDAIEMPRETVYVANIIKCRPPDNRRPNKEEVAQCEPYLHKQIELVKPKVILALGLTAVNTLLRTNHKMGDIRGKVLQYQNTKLIATYHPAALLRNPEWKRATWEDVQMLKKVCEES